MDCAFCLFWTAVRGRGPDSEPGKAGCRRLSGQSNRPCRRARCPGGDPGTTLLVQRSIGRCSVLEMKGHAIQTRSIQHRDTPALAVTARLSATGDAFRWALRMRGACREWERSGRRLNGDALRHVAASMDGETA